MPPNDFFVRTFDVLPGSRVGSQALEDQIELIEQGFELMPGKQALAAGQGNYAVAGGAVDVYTLAASAKLTALTDGVTLTVKFPTALANLTTTPTINVNSLGAKSIVRQNGSAVAAGDLQGVVILSYDTTSGKFMQVSGAGLASEAAAASSAAAALASKNAAATSETNAAASYDSFDDRYLGPKAADPTLDNDGAALLTGALYYNTTASPKEMRVYNGTAWQVAYAPNTSATQVEAETGTEVGLREWSPLRVKQAIAVNASINRSARTADAILAAADRGDLIDITSGTFTQTFTAASTLGDGWFCYIRNAGTGNITLDPDGAELIDGLASFVMYPREARLVICTGTAFYSIVLHAFTLEPTATMTFIEPPGYNAYEVILVAPGGGGGTGRRGAAATVRGGGGGGGGGGASYAVIKAGTPGASVTLTVGASGVGGAAVTTDGTDGNSGTAGGNHSFGSLFSVTGGGGGLLGTAASGGAAGAGGAAGGLVLNAGTAGGANGGAGAASAAWSATGGGSSPNLPTTDVAQDGGAGGANGTNTAGTQLAGGTAGVAAGTRTGGVGNSIAGLRAGTGGGGGASHATLAGGNGGAGVKGGGGGGGAPSVNGQLTGAGGNGGPGYFYVGGII